MTTATIVMGKLATLNKNITKYFYGKVAWKDFSRRFATGIVKDNPPQYYKSENIKQSILEASLPFVNKHGWTYQTIGHGAESLGMQSIAHGLFPNGGVELVLYFYNRCNGNLANVIEEHKSLNMSSFDLIWFAIRERLLMNTPYIQQWPQALALLALPNNIPKSMQSIYKLLDEICYQAGDRSVDFHWYAHRMALLGIYQSTELYMLQDRSEAYESTWKFLSRRIQEAENAKKNVEEIDNILEKSLEAANSTFFTIRNILNIH